MENVTAHQLDASLVLEFAGVADGAKLVSALVAAALLLAVCVEAGQAGLFIDHAVAEMTTGLAALVALFRILHVGKLLCRQIAVRALAISLSLLIKSLVRDRGLQLFLVS